MDAGKVEELKKSIAQSFEAKISDLQKANETATAESAARLKSKDDSIRNLMVRGAFDRSSYLRDATVLPPDLAYQSFGKYCEVSEENGQLRNVWKDFNGQPIFSRANPGTHASDDEAIETLIGAYPMKDRILKAPDGGSGTNGGTGGNGGGKTISRSDFEKLDPARKMQMVTKDGFTVTD